MLESSTTQLRPASHTCAIAAPGCPGAGCERKQAAEHTQSMSTDAEHVVRLTARTVFLLCKRMQEDAGAITAIPLLRCTWLHGQNRTASPNCSTPLFRRRCRVVTIHAMCQWTVPRLSSILYGNGDPETIIRQFSEGRLSVVRAACVMQKPRRGTVLARN